MGEEALHQVANVGEEAPESEVGQNDGTNGEAPVSENTGETTLAADDDGLPPEVGAVPDTEGEIPGEQEGDSTKKTAEERVKEVLEQRDEFATKIQELESRLEEAVNPPEPPYYELDMDKVQGRIKDLAEQEQEFRLEGDYENADKLLMERLDFRKAIEQNEAKRKQYYQQQQQGPSLDDRVRHAADMYRTEMKIPEDVFNKAGEWVSKQVAENALFSEEMRDRSLSSPVSAVRWAYEQWKESESGSLQGAMESREQGKGRVVGGEGSGAPSGVKSFAELMKMPATQISAYKKANPARYEALLSRHRDRNN